MVKTKRAYERPSRADGLRVLVDRLWPRGVTKRAARIDVWAKDLALRDEAHNGAIVLEQEIESALADRLAPC